MRPRTRKLKAGYLPYAPVDVQLSLEGRIAKARREQAQAQRERGAVPISETGRRVLEGEEVKSGYVNVPLPKNLQQRKLMLSQMLRYDEEMRRIARGFQKKRK